MRCGVFALACFSNIGNGRRTQGRRLFSSFSSRASSPVLSSTPSMRFRSWPITEAEALETSLRAMGLRVPAKKIDGTAPGGEGNCLSDALVSVGPAGRGGTGSFISENGLIITNHHVALDAVRQASTPDHDYLNDGFVAKNLGEELTGKDYEVWITRSCVDVSDQLVESRGEKDPLKRANLVRDRRQEIARVAEQALAPAGTAKSASVRCEVQEMWPDRTYVLFTYERLRDVRIVYVPPMDLGNFGGDVDNFEWPRHTADFTLLRAYVALDGSAAESSPDNVPYRPRKFLRASTEGAAPDDFVFLLGFPGSTMRYAPSTQLEYNDQVAVPSLVDDFGEKLELIAKHSVDRSSSLKLVSTKKGLANEYKRSLGKSVMMQKLGLIAERQQEERDLISMAPAAKDILRRLAEIYDQLRSKAALSHALETMQGIFGGSTLLALGHTLHEASVEMARPDAERETPYRARNLPFLVKRLAKRIVDLHPPHEAELLRRALIQASKLPLGLLPLDIELLHKLAQDLEKRGEDALPHIATTSEEKLTKLLLGEVKPPEGDVLIRAATALYAAYTSDRDETKALLSERDQLLARLLELQQKHAKDEVFYPDANGCLRISAGHVEGYSAADAVIHTPVTTLAGLVEKYLEASLSKQDTIVDPVSGKSHYSAPARLVEHCLASREAAATPVCICYSTDTVGGNSGSPVLNADGQFVAINFDRQRQGLMNEFKWSHEFSRSIGTDVRFILFLVGKYDGAQWLVDEMVN